MRMILRLAAMIACITGFSGAAASQGQPCFADWSAAARVVKSEGLVTVDDLVQAAPTRLGGVILRTELCGAEPHYVYRIVIRERGGQIRTLTLDARTPFPAGNPGPAAR